MVTSSALELDFCGGPEHQLLGTRFTFPLLKSPIYARRGQFFRAANAATDTVVGTFGWTAAVRAVAVFFLRVKLSSEKCSNLELHQPLLSGERGSLAASLDSALSKPPQWLLDMFSVDANGTSLLRRIIHRTNPELKRPGPVGLFLQTTQFKSECILVRIEGVQVDDISILHKLLQQLEATDAFSTNLVAANCAVKSSATPLHQVSFGAAAAAQIKTDRVAEHPKDLRQSRTQFLQQLEAVAFKEAQQSLGHTDIFSIRALRLLNQRLSIQSAKRNSSYAWPGTAEMDFGLSSAHLLGLATSPDEYRRAFEQIGKFTLCLTPSHIGAIAIFTYLQSHYGLQLDLRCAFPHTSAILSCIDRNNSANDVTAVTLAHSQSQALLSSSQSEYVPLMFMPATSYSVVTARPPSSGANGGLAKGEYFIFGGRESTSYLVFQDLLERGVLSKSKVRYDSAELHEITSLISSGDSTTRAVLWYPYHTIGGASAAQIGFGDGRSAQRDFREVLLFVNQRLFANNTATRALNMAIRDAWIRLMSDPTLLQQTLVSLQHLAGYEETVYRCSGAWRHELVPANSQGLGI